MTFGLFLRALEEQRRLRATRQDLGASHHVGPAPAPGARSVALAAGTYREHRPAAPSEPIDPAVWLARFRLAVQDVPQSFQGGAARGYKRGIFITANAARWLEGIRAMIADAPEGFRITVDKHRLCVVDNEGETHEIATFLVLP